MGECGTISSTWANVVGRGAWGRSWYAFLGAGRRAGARGAHPQRRCTKRLGGRVAVGGVHSSKACPWEAFLGHPPRISACAIRPRERIGTLGGLRMHIFRRRSRRPERRDGRPITQRRASRSRPLVDVICRPHGARAIIPSPSMHDVN